MSEASPSRRRIPQLLAELVELGVEIELDRLRLLHSQQQCSTSSAGIRSEAFGAFPSFRRGAPRPRSARRSWSD